MLLLPEIRIELPDKLDSFDKFVWIVEPVIERIDDYIKSNGERDLNLVNVYLNLLTV